MNYEQVSLDIEKQVEVLFKDLRSGITAREDSRAFGAMIERRIGDSWAKLCRELGHVPEILPGRRTIFDFACKVDEVLWGFDVKTKDLDSTRYSDGGVCAVGNLLKFLANDKGVFAIMEFGHNKATEGKDLRDLEYIRVAPFHCLPKDAYRIENLGTGQVRLNYTVNQVWNEIDWGRSYSEFFDLFCELAIAHYKRVKSDADSRIRSIESFKANGYASFRFAR